MGWSKRAVDRLWEMQAVHLMIEERSAAMGCLSVTGTMEGVSKGLRSSRGSHVRQR